MNITAVNTATRRAAPSQEEWNALIRPSAGEGESVELGCRSQEPLPTSMAQVRQQVRHLDYHVLDPFVASVGASVGADQVEIPKGESTVALAIPEYYAEDVEVLLGTQNGPNAPMLVILPGIHSDGTGSHSLLFKKLALERGMNYVVLPNSMSDSMLEDKPVYHPGNPRVDALWGRQVIGALKERYPEYFSTISVAGYSYGALEGANLIRLDEEGKDRLIDGGLVAISPPDNLEHSMLQLDVLRKGYVDGGATIADTGLRYKHDVKKLGYPHFTESSLSQHGQGTNIDEMQIADEYGSRNHLQTLVEVVDKQFHHNLLPMNTQEYQDANTLGKMRMRQEHKRIVENMTYEQLSARWMSQDEWLGQHGLTPSEMAERYSFSHALETIHKTPVLVLASADDYIMGKPDIQALRNLEAHPGKLEVTRVFDTGGHVGLDWNPEVATTMIDFALAAKQLKTTH